MQKANVSQRKTKMDKMVRGRELPGIRRSSSLHKKRVVHCAVPLPMERKSDEEAKKAQRKNRRGSSSLWPESEFEKYRNWKFLCQVQTLIFPLLKSEVPTN
jgi:hypothetical protein